MTQQLLAVLREGFEGPSRELGYFLDDGPDAGLRNTLATLTAEEASRTFAGNSVAAHAHHVLFSFDAFGAFIAGDRSSRDWNESWRVKDVDDKQWSKLQDDLARSYDSLKATIQTKGEENSDALRGSYAAVSHLAYHLGAIRQKIVALRAA